MKVTKLNCPSCGSPISFPDDLDFINCSACGSFLGVEHGEGYVALKVAEKFVQAIENSGKGTQDVIRESTQVTRNELQLLQLSQELSSAQIRLANLKAEIRLLEREPPTTKLINELRALHLSEYQLMEQIRILFMKSSIPDPDNLAERLKLTEWELSWINSEITTLHQSNHPKNSQLFQALFARKAYLQHEILSQKILELKARCPSLLQSLPPTDDPAKLAALLALVEKDEKYVRSLSRTPEQEAVYENLLKRKKMLQQYMEIIEKERINDTLGSLKAKVDPNNLASLSEYLALIDQDLQVLDREGISEITQEYRKELLGNRKRLQKQIRVLERKERRRIKIESKSSVNFNKTTPSLENVQYESAAPVKDKASSLAILPDLKAAGIGCLLGFVTLMGFLIFSFFVFGVIITFAPNSENLAGAILFILSAVGLIFGSWIFFLMAAPACVARGFSILPNVKLPHNKTGHGIQKQFLMKLLAGLIIFILGLLIMFSMSVLVMNIPVLLILVVLVGILVSPSAGLYIFLRTTKIQTPESL